MELNSNQIQAIIPHRYPCLLVDKIVEGEEGKWAHGVKCVTANEMHFMGHFPEHHVMPGVLILEALAQTGAVALLSLPEHQGKIAFFGGVKKCRFKYQVVPGDTLDLYCELTDLRGNVGFGTAKAVVGDKIACTAEITFAIN